jgi:PAS domain S-box-containing protein
MRRGDDKFFAKHQSTMPTSIVKEKKIIVDNILKAIVGAGFLLNGITIVRDLEVGVDLTNAVINSSMLMIFLGVLIFGKRISFQLKVWLIIGIFVFIGAKILVINGLAGGTFYFFIMASIVALLILERRRAMYAISIIGVIYLVFLTVMAFHILTPKIDLLVVDMRIRWFSEICSYVFVLFIVIGGVGRVHRSLMSSIIELDESNQKLNQSNEELRNQLEQIKEMENKVAQTEINFKKVFDESNDGIILCNADGIILEANKAIASMLDYPKSFLIGNPSVNFVVSDDKRAINQLSIDKIHTAKIRELHIVGKSGIRIPVEVNYSVIYFNEEKSILVTIRDIRERKQTEQKVLSAVIQAEENERSRFAKDLHDDLGPILSSIKMYIQSLRHHEDSTDKKELINRLVNTVDDSIKSIRKISYNLSSHLLQNMGLINALKTHIERINMSKAFEINFKHNFGDEKRLSSNVEIVTYRVLLELMNNSITHSQGSAISIDLDLQDEQFVIAYSDNGTGFDIDRMLHDNSKGIGLRNILSRVKSIKGLLNFETQKNGFSLVIDISL